MDLKAENWKLLVFSIFYMISPILSYTIKREKFLSFFQVAGIVIILIGLFQIPVYFSEKEHMKPNEFNFSLGVIYCIAGLIAATKSYLTIDNYPTVVFALVVLDATLHLQYSMNLFRLEDVQWKTHLTLIVVPLLMGMVLILVPFEERTLHNLFSFLLILDAITNFHIILYYRGVARCCGRYSEQILDTSNQEATAHEVIGGEDNMV